MYFRQVAFLLLLLCCTGWACSRYEKPPRVLIFSKTTGYRHESIQAGRDALVALCHNNGIWADTTEDASVFEEHQLKRYAAVVFLQTNGEVLNPQQEADFERYIQAGGGFAGIHAASATEYTWRWFGGLLGAYFKDHPPFQEFELLPHDARHPATTHLQGNRWKWKDEPYNFRNYAPDIHLLLSADATGYTGATMPPGAENMPHALSWCHAYDGGRAFYTALGHSAEAYSDPVFLQHLLGGLQYAIGNNKPLRYDRVRSQRAPDPTRFVKTVVANDLDEPMEIALLPDGKIILIERHGYIRLFNPATGLLPTVAKLPVYSEMGDGLLGVAVDPKWENNHWIYLYYSSPTDSLNQLSRFVFRGDSLDRASEKVILKIPVGHKDCFHAAGSITFDGAGNLLLSTGDNTSPFASDGFSPADERPGKKAFDAQRSAANTNDLRGKIIRIKVHDDGTYSCPPGNLFAAGQDSTRPEIYVMGCRNPFRISYDERRELLFWGDIGPDAGKTDTARGPMGHDEINRARAAGFFGWPYFVGDNQAYRDYDYATGKPGPAYDPARPYNPSPNNSGKRALPPAQPAFIWYPYGKNREFPILGSGGRNAMAGPVYYADQYPAATRFPEYYDGKLIVYDWMRSWLMMVTLDSAGNFNRLEPFADSVRMSRPMDMLFDKNGTLWVLEYGTRWYSSNEDARLSRIDYVRGNRPPQARWTSDKTQGSAPSVVQFDGSGSKDFDGDRLRFTLLFGDGKDSSGVWKGGVMQHRYEMPGKYEAVLVLRDPGGASDTARISLWVGNEPPQVFWDLFGHNRSFYDPAMPLRYRVVVNDREDGHLWEGRIDSAMVRASVEFLEKAPNPADYFAKSASDTSAGLSSKYAEGKVLVDKSDCKSCHAVDRQINGPSFQAVAERYRSNKAFAVPAIYRKIIYGGSGNWGQGIMIPHPQIREEEAIQMALWILSLSDPPKPPGPAFALAGSLSNEKSAAIALRAAYRDKGAAGLPPVENAEALLLRPLLFQAENCDKRSDGVGNYKPFNNDTVVLNELKHNAFFVIRQVDLQGLSGVWLRVGYGDKRFPYCGGKLEVRLDTPQGPVLGAITFDSRNAENMVFETLHLPFSTPADVLNKPGFHQLVFIFKNTQNQGQGVVALDWLRFEI